MRALLTGAHLEMSNDGPGDFNQRIGAEHQHGYG